MATAAPDPTAAHHPFTAALAARDIDALVDALAPDAVLHSAITATPFEGREVVTDVYASVFDAFEEFRVTEEFRNDDTHVFFWEGRIDGRYVAGADRIRDQRGRQGARHHDRRQAADRAGRLHHRARDTTSRAGGAAQWSARILRVTALPLAPMFSLVDRIVGWLIRGRPR